MIEYTRVLSRMPFSQAIKEHYKSRKALLGPQQRLVFKENKITLDIPKKGCVLQDDEWKLFPTIPPNV